jgi:hypothetical protein
MFGSPLMDDLELEKDDLPMILKFTATTVLDSIALYIGDEKWTNRRTGGAHIGIRGQHFLLGRESFEPYRKSHLRNILQVQPCAAARCV